MNVILFSLYTTLLLAALVTCYIFMISRIRKFETLLDSREAQISALKQDVSALCVGAGGVANLFNEVDQKICRINDRQDQFEIRDNGSRPYAHAIRLVQGGARMEDLIESCGLAKGEAELIMQIHGMSKAS